jgi:hypothetical protein
MAIIAQKKPLRWIGIDGLGDLERLDSVLQYLPDEKLMKVLEEQQGKGTDDYPVRTM